jgi:hypothetical protein
VGIGARLAMSGPWGLLVSFCVVSHPCPKRWELAGPISHLHLHLPETAVQRDEATECMSRWIARVLEARKRLGGAKGPSPADTLDRVIERMLESEAENRPQAVTVSCILSDSWKGLLDGPQSDGNNSNK